MATPYPQVFCFKAKTILAAHVSTICPAGVSSNKFNIYTTSTVPIVLKHSDQLVLRWKSRLLIIARMLVLYRVGMSRLCSVTFEQLLAFRPSFFSTSDFDQLLLFWATLEQRLSKVKVFSTLELTMSVIENIILCGPPALVFAR